MDSVNDIDKETIAEEAKLFFASKYCNPAYHYISPNWRLPSKDEWAELIENCAWEWVENYKSSGTSGYIVTSLVEGFTDSYIFLPASGYMRDDEKIENGEEGNYWSSDCIYNGFYAGEEQFHPYKFAALKDTVIFFPTHYYLGLSVRAVCEK